jgi:hypothetical protein
MTDTKQDESPEVVRTAPERIWLQVSDDQCDKDKPFPSVFAEHITWCHESVLSCEVEYIRADLASPSTAQAIGHVREDVLAALLRTGVKSVSTTISRECDEEHSIALYTAPPVREISDAQIDTHLDAVLRASGSALKHYTMQKTLDDMRAAMRTAILSSMRGQS